MLSRAVFVLLLIVFLVSASDLDITRKRRRRGGNCNQFNIAESTDNKEIKAKCAACLDSADGCGFTGSLKCVGTAGKIAQTIGKYLVGASSYISKSDIPKGIDSTTFCGFQLMALNPDFKYRAELGSILNAATSMANQAADAKKNPAKAAELCKSFAGNEEQAVARSIQATVDLIQANLAKKKNLSLENVLKVLKLMVDPAHTAVEIIQKITEEVVGKIKEIAFDAAASDAEELEIKNRIEIIKLMVPNVQARRKGPWKLNLSVVTGVSGDAEIDCAKYS